MLSHSNKQVYSGCDCKVEASDSGRGYSGITSIKRPYQQRHSRPSKEIENIKYSMLSLTDSTHVQNLFPSSYSPPPNILALLLIPMPIPPMPIPFPAPRLACPSTHVLYPYNTPASTPSTKRTFKIPQNHPLFLTARTTAEPGRFAPSLSRCMSGLERIAE